MLYKALNNGNIEFQGNNIFDSFIIETNKIDEKLLDNRLNRVKKEKQFYHLNNIDN